MSVSRPLAVSVGLAAGLVAAVGFYTAAVGADAPQKVTAKPQPVPAVAVMTPAPVVSFAPCAKPAKLQHGACVTHKVVTKVIPAPAPAPAPAPVSRPAAPVVAAVSPSSTGTSRRVAAATPQSAPPATVHEDANDDAVEPEHEDADHEDHDGTEAGEHEDHEGAETGDDASEPGDD